MTTQAESKLSQNILKELRAHKIFAFKVHGSAMMMAGLPDIIACVGGHFVGLESKMPGKRENTSARQDYVRDLIRESDGTYLVVTSVDEALNFCLEFRNLK